MYLSIENDSYTVVLLPYNKVDNEAVSQLDNMKRSICTTKPIVKFSEPTDVSIKIYKHHKVQRKARIMIQIQSTGQCQTRIQ